MNIGELRDRVTIQGRVHARAADGELVATWSTFVTVWAKIEDAPAPGEGEQSDQVQGVTTHRITVRYLSTLVGELRVKHGTVIYAVQSVESDNGRCWTSLGCAQESPALSGTQTVYIVNDDDALVTDESDGNYLTTTLAA
jgi:head-tail adaptor